MRGNQSGYCQPPLRGLLQNVSRNDIRAEGAGWRFADFSNCVSATGGAFRQIPFCIQFDVRFSCGIKIASQIRADVVNRDDIIGHCIMLQSPLILESINPPHIIDASVSWRSPRVSNKIGDHNKGKKQKNYTCDY